MRFGEILNRNDDPKVVLEVLRFLAPVLTPKPRLVQKESICRLIRRLRPHLTIHTASGRVVSGSRMKLFTRAALFLDKKFKPFGACLGDLGVL